MAIRVQAIKKPSHPRFLAKKPVGAEAITLGIPIRLVRSAYSRAGTAARFTSRSHGSAWECHSVRLCPDIREILLSEFRIRDRML
ncbi:MAG: hypothetical protein GY749_18960 [Desulfobacteraceae bacterium]|nr:hypothetical protein [Desulfobacteraceae bacterium]